MFVKCLILVGTGVVLPRQVPNIGSKRSRYLYFGHSRRRMLLLTVQLGRRSRVRSTGGGDVVYASGKDKVFK